MKLEIINYPYVFLDKDVNSMTYNEWCVRLDESTSLDGYETEEQAYADANWFSITEK